MLTQQLNESQALLEALAGEESKTVDVCQFWAKGKAVQFQIGKKSAADPEGQFLDFPASLANLTAEYAAVQVRWFSGEPDSRVNVWFGEERNGVHLGAAFLPFQMPGNDCRFPRSSRPGNGLQARSI